MMILSGFSPTRGKGVEGELSNARSNLTLPFSEVLGIKGMVLEKRGAVIPEAFPDALNEPVGPSSKTTSGN